MQSGAGFLPADDGIVAWQIARQAFVYVPIDTRSRALQTAFALLRSALAPPLADSALVAYGKAAIRVTDFHGRRAALLTCRVRDAASGAQRTARELAEKSAFSGIARRLMFRV
ncbi:hypothetical protein BN2476_100087 [Paraburkholderia piptadeniae]|uniref:Uncharacterized protein n=1 Tax=Paraburkholderia piptadeniae TaxID=1701573 RepID=A0A1N7RNU2_9BURK|nr:hypothetical protein BN2476_100087 [Paraburkholderia piptadeniae]